MTEPRKPTPKDDIEAIRHIVHGHAVVLKRPYRTIEERVAAFDRIVAKLRGRDADIAEQKEAYRLLHKSFSAMQAKLRKAERERDELGRRLVETAGERTAISIQLETAEARAERLAEALSLVAANTSDVHILKVADAALREARREET